jgi:hypothetical protein
VGQKLPVQAEVMTTLVMAEMLKSTTRGQTHFTFVSLISTFFEPVFLLMAEKM